VLVRDGSRGFPTAGAFEGFLTHFDDLIGDWHRSTDLFARNDALPQLRIERTNELLQRDANMMVEH
jgi:hypothetical protein